MRAICTFSGVVVANTRHSAYGLRMAAIAYPWHPLFGRTLQVSPFRRGKELKCIYTEERPDLSRELPNWMFDQGYCVAMKLGPPEISIAGLNELAAVLASPGETQKPGACSSSSKTKEKDRAKKQISKSKPTRSRTGTPGSPASDEGREGAGRGAGRSAAGSPGRGPDPDADEDGRRG